MRAYNGMKNLFGSDWESLNQMNGVKRNDFWEQVSLCYSSEKSSYWLNRIQLIGEEPVVDGT